MTIKSNRRDYCEACGYTESHDPNCSGPIGKLLVERLRLVQDCHGSICKEAADYIEQSDDGYEDDSARLLELHAEIAGLREQLRLANVDAANQIAERNGLLDLLSDAGLELARCKVFVGSREKMHPDGLTLYQDLLDRIDAAMKEQK